MLRACFAVLAALVLVAPTASALNFTDLYVFGDSLVDAGNTQNLAGGPGSTGDPTPSSLGYFDGRFTNGPTISDVVNLAIEGTLSSDLAAGGDNFAFGGARARNNTFASAPLSGDAIPDLAQQVSTFSSSVSGVADSGALYLINAGGNDIFDALTLAGAAMDPTPVINDAIAAITGSVLSLQSMGAQHILFVGVGDVGSPPAANGFETEGRFFSEQINAGIQANLPAGASFFDTIGFFDSVLADPTAFGLPAGLLTETSCLGDSPPDPQGPPTSLCENYAFFDDVHPTSELLTLLGDEIVAVVPEPGTAALVGLGLLGLGARRRAERRAA